MCCVPFLTPGPVVLSLHLIPSVLITWLARPVRRGVPGLIWALCLVLLAVVPVPLAAQELLSHRAQYTVSLDRSTSAPLGVGPNVVDASGVFQIEISDVCEGWSSSQRLNVTLSNAGGGGVVADTVFASWEAKDGQDYRFETRTSRNNYVSDHFSGTATLEGDAGGVAEYVYPQGNRVVLPAGTLFPARHVMSLIEGALRGDRVMASRAVFDGASREGMFDVSAVIGKPVDSEPDVNEFPESVKLARYWPVRLAYFKVDGGQTPEHEVSVDLSEDGVAYRLVFDYGQFSLKAELKEFQIVQPVC